MKNIAWKYVPQPKRKELQNIARRMKRKGYSRIQLNYHGASRWSVDGFNSSGGVWIS